MKLLDAFKRQPAGLVLQVETLRLLVELHERVVRIEAAVNAPRERP